MHVAKLAESAILASLLRNRAAWTSLIYTWTSLIYNLLCCSNCSRAPQAIKTVIPIFLPYVPWKSGSDGPGPRQKNSVLEAWAREVFPGSEWRQDLYPWLCPYWPNNSERYSVKIDDFEQLEYSRLEILLRPGRRYAGGIISWYYIMMK
jgi:hypothetical protein